MNGYAEDQVKRRLLGLFGPQVAVDEAPSAVPAGQPPASAPVALFGPEAVPSAQPLGSQFGAARTGPYPVAQPTTLDEIKQLLLSPKPVSGWRRAAAAAAGFFGGPQVAEEITGYARRQRRLGALADIYGMERQQATDVSAAQYKRAQTEEQTALAALHARQTQDVGKPTQAQRQQAADKLSDELRTTWLGNPNLGEQEFTNYAHSLAQQHGLSDLITSQHIGTITSLGHRPIDPTKEVKDNLYDAIRRGNRTEIKRFQGQLSDLDPSGTERLHVLEQRLDLATQQAQARQSKIPMVTATRLTNIMAIRDQIDHIRTLLDDPEVGRYIGPVVGVAAPVTTKVNAKLAGLQQTLVSLAAFQPIVHGYRGGQRTHAIFMDAANLRFQPQALKGTLDEAEGMANRLESVIRRQYPGDPLWQELDTEGGQTAQGTMKIPTAPAGPSLRAPGGARLTHKEGDRGTIQGVPVIFKGGQWVEQ